VEFTLPTLTDIASMSDFAGHVERVEAYLLILDPTYLALGDVDARNLFEMGGRSGASETFLRPGGPT